MELKKRISRFFADNNSKMSKLLLVLLVGICLLVIAWPVKDKKDTYPGKTSAAQQGQTISDEEDKYKGAGETDYDDGYLTKYTEYMEERLCSVLSRVEGVSDVSVMITLKNSGEKIALRDNNNSRSDEDGKTVSSSSEETVIEKQDSNSSPYIIKYIEPEIEGVIVCCKGGESGGNSLKITNAIQALFDVPTHKIVILEGN